MTRVAVIGGREYRARARLFQILDAAVPRLGLVLLICPRTVGVGLLAIEWAAERKVQHEQIVFHWGRHGRYATEFGNRQIVEDHKPDVLLAFPGDDETADLVKQCSLAGIRVVRVDWPILPDVEATA